MIRLLVLAVSLLMFATAIAGGQDAGHRDPAAEARNKQQHKRTIERHTRQTRIREERHRTKRDTDASDVEAEDDKKDDSEESKKPQ